jgi:hypothetical protein
MSLLFDQAVGGVEFFLLGFFLKKMIFIFYKKNFFFDFFFFKNGIYHNLYFKFIMI